jgi:hypothetical protein
MGGHAQDMQVAVAALEGEQDVEPPQRDRAVDVEEVDREHAGRLGAQEPPPAGVGVPDRRGWDLVTRQDPPDRRGTRICSDALDDVVFDQVLLRPTCSPPANRRSPCALRMWVPRTVSPSLISAATAGRPEGIN